jgi:hypothetical protein
MADTHSDSGDARWTVKDRLCVAVPVAMLTTIGWASLFLFLNNQVPWYRELIEDHGIEIRDLYRPMFDAAELIGGIPGLPSASLPLSPLPHSCW